MCLRSLETSIQISEELIQTSEGSSYREARVGEVCHLESLRNDNCQSFDRQHRLGSATVILGAEFCDCIAPRKCIGEDAGKTSIWDITHFFSCSYFWRHAYMMRCIAQAKIFDPLAPSSQLRKTI